MGNDDNTNTENDGAVENIENTENIENIENTENVENVENNERIKSLESEYAELDKEMAEQYYYITNDGDKMGPFTMDQVTDKYKSNDITDDTRIWSGDETKSNAKPLKQNEKIYS